MSYILDALRRADAERERDPARGIHAQPVTLRTAAEGTSLARPLTWGAAAVAAGALLAAVVLLWPARQDKPAEVPASPRAEASAAVYGSAAPTRGSHSSREMPAAEAGSTGIAAAPAHEILPAPEPLAVPKAAPSVEAPKMPSGARATARTSSPASDRILERSELPAEVQRELPALAISGGVHSPNPAQRMLIVGGQIVNEGAELAPGLRLEEIRPKTAVLRFRGYRYSVGY